MATRGMPAMIDWVDHHPRASAVAACLLAFAVVGALDTFRTGISALLPDAIFALGIYCWRTAAPQALALVWLGAITQLLVQPSVMFGDALVLPAVFMCGRDARFWVQLAGFASSIVGGLAAAFKLILVSGVLLPNEPAAHTPSELALYYVAVSVMVAAALALFAALGAATRTRGELSVEQLERSETERERLRAELRVAQEAERVRISREMHDAIGHTLAVVIAQSDGARYALLDNPGAAAQALKVINRSARMALDDVAAALDQLASPTTGNIELPEKGTRNPPVRSRGLRELDQLIADMRASGLNIQRQEHGQARALSTGVDHAVFRIIQESLTNALKHGGSGTNVELTLSWENTAVTVQALTEEILTKTPIEANPRNTRGNIVGADLGLPSTGPSTGPGSDPDAAHRGARVHGGRGIAGMRERVRLIGGEFSANPRQDGTPGFVVRAHFPLGALGENAS